MSRVTDKLDEMTDDEILEGTDVVDAGVDDAGTKPGEKPDAEALIEELSKLETVDVAALRRLPGAEALKDDELLAMWEEANKPPKPRSYKLYKDDKELEDFSDLSVEDMLEQIQFGYQALGKEQRKTFNELVRNASLGHYNEQRVAELKNGQLQIHEKYTKLNEEHEGWRKDRMLVEQALSAAAAGNVQPLQALVAAYTKAALEPGQEAVAESAAGTDDDNAAGMRVYYEYIVPEADKLAAKYKVERQEITEAIMYLIDQEPPELLTADRVKQIIEIEIPNALENRAAANPSKPDPRDAELAELKKQVAALTAQKENAETTALRNRKPAPPPGAGHTPGNTVTMPAFKNREEAKEWLRK